MQGRCPCIQLNESNEHINQTNFCMAKNSTLFSNEPSFISENPEKLKEQISESPSDQVIQNILNFSKALKVHKSSTAGVVEIVLN